MRAIAWCVLLSLLLVSTLAWSSQPLGRDRPFRHLTAQSGGTGDQDLLLPAPPICSEDFEFSENAAEFRWQLIDYFHEIELDLKALLDHPGLQSLNDECVPTEELEIAAQLEQELITASVEEIEELQASLGKIPGLAAVPARLKFALQQLPQGPSQTNAADSCSGATLELVLGLKLGAKALAIAGATLHGIYDAIDDDSTAWKKWVIAAAAIAALADIATLVLEGAVDIAEFSYGKKQECLADLCVVDNFNTDRRGRGCDGLDQDCQGGPDDCMEDRSPPRVSLLRTVETECYPTLAAAEAAVFRHSSAADDCRATEIDWPMGAIPEDSCDAAIQITASDACDNVSSAVQTILTIDDEPPLVVCQVELDTLIPANNAFMDVGLTYTAIDGCDGSPEVEVEVTTDEPTATAYGTAEGSSQSPDAQVIPLADGQFRLLLRAERSSSPHGDGRVYRVRVTATDRCGNSGEGVCLVSVPLASPSSPAINSGQRFDATVVN